MSGALGMNWKSRRFQFALVICLGLIIVGCGGRGLVSSQAAQGDAPPTIQFSATPTTVTAGQSVTLVWSTTNTTSVSIDGGIGTVAITGNKTVNPAATQTFVLTATGPGGTAA